VKSVWAGLYPLVQQSFGSVVIENWPSVARLTGTPNGGAGLIGAGLSYCFPPTYSENQGRIQIPVWRTLGTQGAVSVRYRTEAGSARAGIDFRDTSGTLSWADGIDGVLYALVDLLEDDEGEAKEDFRLVLEGATGATVIGCEAKVEIRANGPPPVVLPAPSAVPPADSSSKSGGGGAGGIGLTLLGLLLASRLGRRRSNLGNVQLTEG
jgi:hypothetical protein